MSLRFRLNSLIVIVLFAIVLAGGSLVIINARRSVSIEISSSVNLAVGLIDYELSNKIISDEDLRNWTVHLRRLERSRHLEINIQSPMNDQDPVETVDLFKLVSGVPSWFIWAVAPQSVRIEKPVSISDGRDVSLVIQAYPYDEITEAWGEARVFFLTILIFAGLICALVTLTVERAFRSVSQILIGLEKIEKGVFSEPLPDFPLSEMTQIAKAINHTAGALDKARIENKALTQHSLEIQEQERQYLAQELHDEFGQSLSAIKAIAVSLKAGNPSQHRLSSINAIAVSCDHMFSVLRTMMRRLHPMILDDLGLQASVEDMIQVWPGRSQGHQINFECDKRVEKFSKGEKIQIFRIVQECLTNIVKHADAREVHVSLKIVNDSVSSSSNENTMCNGNLFRLRVVDNGVGFNLKSHSRGFGLMGIRERVESLGGMLVLHTKPGEGCCVSIDIPVKQEPQQCKE